MKSSLKRLSISVLLLIPLLAVACSSSEPNSTKNSEPSSNQSVDNKSSNGGDNSGNSQTSNDNSSSSSKGDVSSNGETSSNGGNSSISQNNQFNIPNGKEELDKLAAKNGYEFTYSVKEAGTTTTSTLGAKGSDKWIVSGSSGYGLKADKYESKDICHVFTKETTWVYSYALLDASFISDIFTSAINEVGLNDNQIQQSVKTASGTKTTVINREVAKFSLTIDGAKGDLYVDLEYGILLKMETTGYIMEITNFSVSANAPYANVSVPNEFDLYQDYTSAYTGQPINAPKLNLPNNVYVKYQTYTVLGEDKRDVVDSSFMKIANDTLEYRTGTGNGNLAVTQYQNKVGGNGYTVRGATIYSGSGRAQWNNPAEQDQDQFDSYLKTTFAASTYLQYKKSANAVASKDKTIAGINCKAYEYVDNSLVNYGITSEYKFWIEPNTNIIFYGYTKATVNGRVTERVIIDILEYSTSLTSFYDHACEQLLYREGNGQVQESDTHHVQSNETVIREATCIRAGEKGTKCIYCGHSIKTADLPIDPNNHDEVPNYWSDDGEGHHVKYCNACYEIAEKGDHVCDQEKLHATCSGKLSLKCTVCNNDINFTVNKSETHTYSLTMPELNPNYLFDADTEVQVSWHCDCYYESGSTPGADKTWTFPKLGNTNYFSYKDYYGSSEYTAKKDALVTNLKTAWPNESDANLQECIDTILGWLGFYNGKLTIY